MDNASKTEVSKVETDNTSKTGDSKGPLAKVKGCSFENFAIFVGGILQVALIAALGGLFALFMQNEEHKKENHEKVVAAVKETCHGGSGIWADLQLAPGDKFSPCPTKAQTNTTYFIMPLRIGVTVLCETQMAGGGWVVFQRRSHQTFRDFHKTYQEYKFGFGELIDNFWLGLDSLHYFCNPSSPCEMRVDFNFGIQAWAQYVNFHVGNESSGFVLHLSGFTGGTSSRLNLVDGLSYSSGGKFSTWDFIPDETIRDCITSDPMEPGWWFKGVECYKASPNGQWDDKATWPRDALQNLVIHFIEMKFRKPKFPV